MNDKLLNILNAVLSSIGIDVIETLDPALDLRDDLEIDSISYAELIVRIEEEFDVNVNDEGRVNTIADLISRLS